MKGLLKGLAELLGTVVVGTFTFLFILVVLISPALFFGEEKFILEWYVILLAGLGTTVVLIFYALILSVKHQLDELPCQNDETETKRGSDV
jgi:hypothetical protein